MKVWCRFWEKSVKHNSTTVYCFSVSDKVVSLITSHLQRFKRTHSLLHGNPYVDGIYIINNIFNYTYRWKYKLWARNQSSVFLLSLKAIHIHLHGNNTKTHYNSLKISNIYMQVQISLSVYYVCKASTNIQPYTSSTSGFFRALSLL